jgi:lipooligosaccharide transport system permease protein
MTTLTLAVRPLEFFFAQYRRVWRGTAVSSVVTPVVYLLALGVGLSEFVGDVTFRGKTYDYLEFVAPGLLAATAMQVASFEASWPVLSAIKWSRQYHAMLATPLRVRDVVAGHQAFIAARILTTTAVYVVVITVLIAYFGGSLSPYSVLAIPVAGLVGLAFAAPIAAWAAHTETDSSFVMIFRFVLLPMFLFSGTFFPISRLPAAFEAIAYVTPLWHGVDLSRQLMLGDIVLSTAFAHVLFLVAWIVVCMTIALIAYRRRLLL